MMSLSSYLGFLLATVALVLLPGPNVALIVGNSLAGGKRLGLAIILGTASAAALQVGATVFGLALLLASAAPVFAWLRWLGVVYLAVLGLRAWFAAPVALDAGAAPRSVRRAVATGFAVSLTNPKTLLFLGAFLPQFVDPQGNAGAQLLLLGGTFVVVSAALDCGWALLASRFGGLIALRPRLRNRMVGGTLIGAACGLALAHERG